MDDIVGCFSPDLFRGKGWAARTLSGLFNLHSTTIGQAGVLLSAALQMIVLIATVSLAITPFGQSGDLLIANLGKLGRDIHVGDELWIEAAQGTRITGVRDRNGWFYVEGHWR